MVSERGQATIEWTGLALLVALVLGALAALAPRLDSRGLGATVAHAITCAARGGCAGESTMPLRRGSAEPVLPRDRASPQPPAGGAGAGLRALRGAGDVAKKVWIVCLRYRSYLYERDHPLAGVEGIPLDEGLDITNECLNPLGFFRED